jgi:Tol biopolymer transport system component
LTDRLLAWSPNSQWLAFYGQKGEYNDNGLWLFSPNDQKLKLVTKADDHYRGSPVWSPDGKEIATISFDESSPTTELYIFNIATISNLTQ